MNGLIVKRMIRTYKAAVLLAGCGQYDGSEIFESFSLLASLSRAGCEYKCFAPDKGVLEIDHTKKIQGSVSRNMMKEAARIARGDISPLDSLKIEDFDALFLPGGSGTVTNLMGLTLGDMKSSIKIFKQQLEGKVMVSEPETLRVLNGFFEANKPIGVCCGSNMITSSIFGKIFGRPGIKLTLGKKGEGWIYSSLIGLSVRLGNTVIECDPHEICIDVDNKFVSTPCYLQINAKHHEVSEAINKLVNEALSLVKL